MGDEEVYSWNVLLAAVHSAGQPGGRPKNSPCKN
jgi:hypothetical protein